VFDGRERRDDIFDFRLPIFDWIGGDLYVQSFFNRKSKIANRQLRPPLTLLDMRQN